MGNKKPTRKISLEVYTHKGGTQSTNSLSSLIQRGNYFSCKIILDKLNYGSGFFAKILSQSRNSKIIKVLFTCYHVLTEEFLNSHNVINLEFNNDEKRNILLNKNRLIWLNKYLDYTCIEILDEDNISEFLNIDFEIYEENYNTNLENEEVLLLAFNKDENDENSKQSCEFGILHYDKDIEAFLSSYNSTHGASGGVVLLKRGYKLIGMHKGAYKDIENNKNLNVIIPLNIILKDLNSNENSVCKLKLEDSKKENLNTIKVEKEEIIEKYNKSDKESNKNIIEEKKKTKIENEEIKKEDNFELNLFSEHMGELNDLFKDMHFSIICQECGEIIIKEIEMGKIEFVKMMIDSKILENCKKCGKNNYGYDIPYLNIKCKNCGNNLFEKSFPFQQIGILLALKSCKLKDCEICGKNDFILCSERKK